jgi:hypothetical protein
MNIRLRVAGISERGSLVARCFFCEPLAKEEMIFCGEKRGGRIGGVEGMMWFVFYVKRQLPFGKCT